MSMLHDEVAIRMTGGVAVLAPATLRSITTYVLLEQEDWFEAEIGFVRALLGPGMRALDIGANYGVYALTMARSVGADGVVVAFEPAVDTSATLQRSATLNGFGWLSVQAAAVGAQSGAGRLHGELPELRSLVAASDAHARDAAPDVTVVSLDDWSAGSTASFDFVKVDVEGAEAQVIAGGQRFFAQHDPLVMIEVKADRRFDFTAVMALAALGYDAYRLLPGASALAPVARDMLAGHVGPDGWLLNLFCCKPSRARRLEQRGLLATAPVVGPAVDNIATGAGEALCRAQPAFRAIGEAQHRGGPFAPEAGSERYLAALDLYAAAGHGDANHRVGCLDAAGQSVIAAIDARATVPRMLSAMRILAEAGRVGRAAQMGLRLVDALAAGSVRLREPFLAALPRYAAVPLALDGLAGWVVAQVAESLENCHAYSTAFDSAGTLERIAEIERCGFLTAGLERRRQLVNLASGRQHALQPHPLLRDCLNPQLWSPATRLRP